jgi:hypothetical protein
MQQLPTLLYTIFVFKDRQRCVRYCIARVTHICVCVFLTTAELERAQAVAAEHEEGELVADNAARNRGDSGGIESGSGGVGVSRSGGGVKSEQSACIRGVGGRGVTHTSHLSKRQNVTTPPPLSGGVKSEQSLGKKGQVQIVWAHTSHR